MRWISVVAVVLMSSLAARGAAAADVFHFSSSPQSWIGQGQTLTFTSPETPFFASRYFSQGAYTNAVSIGAGGYSLTMVGENYSLPTVGFYGDATRWPFMDDGNGMDLAGPGRGNNMLTGWYNVLQADYNPDGTVRAFAVDFLQLDEGFEKRWNTGAIRYNSSIAFIPEPVASTTLLLALPLLVRRRRRR